MVEIRQKYHLQETQVVPEHPRGHILGVLSYQVRWYQPSIVSDNPMQGVYM